MAAAAGWNGSEVFPNTTAGGFNVTGDKLFDGYPPGLLTFASVTCLCYMLIGVPGNLITIIALARCKKVRNATAVFIINLSLSDLLFCCFNLPLAASTYWFRAWTHGDLLCRLFPLLRYGLSAVSLFTVLAITLNRYVMIGHPRVYPKIYRHRYLGVMVAGTWIFAFSALIPTWRGTWGRFGLDRTIGSCSILPDADNTSPKDFFFVMAFVVPCVAIVVCYARIFYIVRKTAMRSHEPALQQKSLNASMIIPMQPSPSVRNATSTRPAPTRPAPTAASSATKLSCPQKTRRNRDPDSSNSVTEPSSEHSSSTTSTCHTHPCVPGHGPRLGLKFIDSSVDSEMPSTLAAMRHEPLHVSSVSIGKSVEFRSDVSGGTEAASEEMADGAVTLMIEDGGVEGEDEQEMSTASAGEKGRVSNVRRKRFRQNGQRVQEVDSAVEESTSSSENNQIYHIRNESQSNAELVAVQVEPSSSSGIDIPMDEDEAPPRRNRRSLAASLRRIKRSRQPTAEADQQPCENTLGRINSRKHSTINTSGASILYPGRMSTKDRRLLKMIFVILTAFVVCYLPITASKIIRPIQQNSYLNIMGYLLIYLTTCINPIIYVVMSSEYRQAYWNLLMCRVTVNGGGRRPTVRERNHPQQAAAQRLVANT